MPARDSEFTRGARAAAAIVALYNASSAHDYRLEDCVLAKLNIGRRKPRKNTYRIKRPEDAWLCGIADGLTEMFRADDRTGVRQAIVQIAERAGLTLAIAKRVGVRVERRRELRRAGVR